MDNLAPTEQDGVAPAVQTGLPRPVLVIVVLTLLVGAVLVVARGGDTGSGSDQVAVASSTPSTSSTPSPSPSPSASATVSPSPSASATAAAWERLAGIGDDLFPRLGNRGYDVEHYDLRLVYEPASGQIDASAALRLVVTESLDTLVLDLAGLEVSSVTVDGASAEIEQVDHEVVAGLPTAVSAGDILDVTVAYGGTPVLVSDGAPTGEASGWFALDDGGVVVLSEPAGAHGWFPGNDHPLDKATYTIEVVVPDGLRAVANGTPLGSAEVGDGTVAWRYAIDEPVASYLVTVLIGDLSVAERSTADGLPLTFVAEAAEMPRLLDAAKPLAEMVDVLDDWFGPYPFDRYGVAVAPGEWGLALEVQTLSVFGADMLDDPVFAEHVMVHELAHQWWGDAVSITRWGDTWIKEGLATYSEQLWLEATRPGYDLDDFFASIDPPRRLLSEHGVEDMYSFASYFGAADAFHALRRELGDDGFATLLRSMFAELDNGHLTTDDLIDRAEAVAGRPLDKWVGAYIR